MIVCMVYLLVLEGGVCGSECGVVLEAYGECCATLGVYMGTSWQSVSGFTPQSFPHKHQQVQVVRNPGPNYDIICRVEGEGLNVSFSAQRAIGFGETLGRA